MEKKQKEPAPNFEILDPKPPVIRSGHLENRTEHESQDCNNTINVIY